MAGSRREGPGSQHTSHNPFWLLRPDAPVGSGSFPVSSDGLPFHSGSSGCLFCKEKSYPIPNGPEHVYINHISAYYVPGPGTDIALKLLFNFLIDV